MSSADDKKAKNLEKAREVKKQKAQERREAGDTYVWKMVSARIETYNCKCGLRPGMKLEELMPPNMPGSGCQDKWVCPALDSYRRLLGH